MTSLDVRGLGGRVRGHPRVDSATFAVRSGSVGAIFGRPEAGKRTLLRLLAGLDRADSGEIRVDGNNVAGLPPHQRRLGVVMRDAPLFPGTVRDNVVYGLRAQGWARDDRERRVAAALELVGMTGTERERVASLNADERSRIALARALAPQPSVLLLESPTAHVDEVLKPDYRARLREVLRSIPLTTLIFTDDLRDAVGMADDLHVLSNGGLLQSGSLSRVLAGPASIEVAEMVGYVTLIRGDVEGDRILEPGAGEVQFPAGFPLSGTARALAHPATMLGVPESSGLGCGVAGVVERVRAVGPTHVLDLRVGDRLLEVRWEWDPEPPGLEEPVSIAVTPGTLRFFNETAPALGRQAPRPADWRGFAAPTPEEDPGAAEWPGDGDAFEESAAARSSTAGDDFADEPDAEDMLGEDAAPEPARPRPWDASQGPAAASPPRQRTEDWRVEQPHQEMPPPPEVDPSVERLAPWLQVSRPVEPRRRPDDPDELASRHQGMPLD